MPQAAGARKDSVRRLRYCVAMSLDGYIADADGGFDWIIMDPDIDFVSLFAQFDTLVMGRKTFEVVAKMEGGGVLPGPDVIVFSKTLRQEDYPTVRIECGDAVEVVKTLKAAEGKDIWLYGGGELFRSLLAARLVDTVEVAIIPVLTGGGLPLLPAWSSRTTLTLTAHRVYATGIVSLDYAVNAV